MDESTIALLTGPVSALGLALMGYLAIWHLLTKIAIPHLSSGATRFLDQIDKLMSNMEKIQEEADKDRQLFREGFDQINDRLDRLTALVEEKAADA